MLSIKFLVEDLGVFERDKTSLKLKILGLVFYIQFSSLRRVAKALSKMYRVSKSAIWKWIKKFSEKINVNLSKMLRKPCCWRKAW
jgi:hypothetical protein